MLPQSAPNTLKGLMVHKDASWPRRIHHPLGYDLLFTLKRIQKLNHPGKKVPKLKSWCQFLGAHRVRQSPSKDLLCHVKGVVNQRSHCSLQTHCLGAGQGDPPPPTSVAHVRILLQEAGLALSLTALLEHPCPGKPRGGGAAPSHQLHNVSRLQQMGRESPPPWTEARDWGGRHRGTLVSTVQRSEEIILFYFIFLDK